MNAFISQNIAWHLIKIWRSRGMFLTNTKLPFSLYIYLKLKRCKAVQNRLKIKWGLMATFNIMKWVVTGWNILLKIICTSEGFRTSCRLHSSVLWEVKALPPLLNTLHTSKFPDAVMLDWCRAASHRSAFKNYSLLHHFLFGVFSCIDLYSYCLVTLLAT